MKYCSGCNENKDLAMFGKNLSTEDGLMYKCRACLSAYQKARRERLNASKPPDWKQKSKDKLVYQREWRAKHPGYHTQRKKDWYAQHKDRVKVKDAVKYAVKTGKLVKTPCEVCGEVRVEGHHPDYSKPLNVVWLCRKHHQEIHSSLHQP